MRRVLTLILFVGACTANSGDESFIVRANLVPMDNACDFQADLIAPTLPRGIISTASRTAYLVNPLLESRIVAAEGKESLRTIMVKGAHVNLTVGPTEIVDPGGAVTIDSTIKTYQFDSLTSAALPPNSGLTFAQFDGVSLSAIADVKAAAGANHVHAQATISAVMFGDFYGEELNSNAFVYPVTICNDCVIATDPPPACPLMGQVRAGNPCNPFQDGTVDCCTGANGIVCPGTM
jgi:hypothetical protein